MHSIMGVDLRSPSPRRPTRLSRQSRACARFQNPMPGSETVELKNGVRNFAITGVAGYVAPRHLAAIRETGHRLVAALDPHDSVGVLDSFFFDATFFTEFERFDRHLEKLRRKGEADRVHYLSICAPNYLHDAHIRLALRLGAHALCEKPLVVNPWNLDALQELEVETGSRVFTVHQLRFHPSLRALKERIDREDSSTVHRVELKYITPRGRWYPHSWKGSVEKSGGLLLNIGIHFFDLLLWIFGPARTSRTHILEPSRAAGHLELARAEVRWFLSLEKSDLADPNDLRPYRSLRLNGEEIEFSEGFTNLHKMVYLAMLEGRGCGIDDVRPSIELVHRIRHSTPDSRVEDLATLVKSDL